MSHKFKRHKYPIVEHLNHTDDAMKSNSFIPMKCINYVNFYVPHSANSILLPISSPNHYSGPFKREKSSGTQWSGQKYTLAVSLGVNQ